MGLGAAQQQESLKKEINFKMFTPDGANNMMNSGQDFTISMLDKIYFNWPEIINF